MSRRAAASMALLVAAVMSGCAGSPTPRAEPSPADPCDGAQDIYTEARESLDVILATSRSRDLTDGERERARGHLRRLILAVDEFPDCFSAEVRVEVREMQELSGNG